MSANLYVFGGTFVKFNIVSGANSGHTDSKAIADENPYCVFKLIRDAGEAREFTWIVRLREVAVGGLDVKHFIVTCELKRRLP